MTPDATTAALAELLAQAPRLGLTWQRRPGTVASTTSPHDPRANVAVAIDGEPDTTVTVTATSLVGPVAPGMRVMVDELPPTTRHITGILSGAETRAVAATDTTASITTETVVLTLPSVRLLPQAAYRVRAGGAILAATTVYATYGLRLGTIAGTQAGVSGNTPGVGLASGAFTWQTCIRTGTTGTTTDVLLTMTATGAGAAHYGAAQTPRYLEITYAGAAADFPHAVTVT